MNKNKRNKRAKLKAKESRSRISRKNNSEPLYKWDGKNWLKLTPVIRNGEEVNLKMEVMPEGFEPKSITDKYETN